MIDKLSDEQIEAAKAAGFSWHPIWECLVVRHSNGAWSEVSDKLARFAALLAASPAPAIPMPPLNDAMRAVLTNENCVYGTPDELYAALVMAAPAISESEDTKLLDFIAAESVDLVSFAIPYEDDADIGWRVLQHHIGEAEPRVIGEVFKDDPRAAIRAARKGEKS
ncbi:hypothetical protein [Burkholderia gladioli]|uniref:hypothetical protein n=1 Tax=Burkholderia gladioli TaxID=28095 RepID=UPI001641F805|nr:hypothetical protein [Burkholderia gladioli]